MKCRFFLLDINEDLWENQPSCRLWGLDENGVPVLVIATLITPYFYAVPTDQEDPDQIIKELSKNRARFPKMLRAELDSKKLLGRECKAVKIVCSDPRVISTYAKGLAKIMRKTQCYEQDLRLSTRCIVDWMLTPCGWHECEVDTLDFKCV